MDRDLSLAVVGLVVVGILLGILLWFATIFVLWGGSIGSAILLGLLYARGFPVRTVRGPPEQALAYLAYRLRLEGLRATGEPGQLTVPLGRFTSVRILVRGTPDGSLVLYHPYLSSRGWGWILLLVLTMWGSLLGIPLLLVTFLRARRFATTRLPALFSPEGGVPQSFRPDDIRVLLLDGLAEGHRLASEAYESVQDTYVDVQGVVLLCAILAFFLLFLGFFTSIPNPDFSLQIRDAAGLALAATAAFTLPVAAIVREMYRERIARFREWAARLREATSRESAQALPEEGSPTVFELLAETSRQVPAWIDAKRRAGMSRDPGMWFLLFIMAMFALELFFWIVPAATTGEPLIAILALGLGILLSVGVFALYRRWKTKFESRLARELGDWSRTVDETRSKMERFLRDL